MNSVLFWDTNAPALVRAYHPIHYDPDLLRNMNKANSPLFQLRTSQYR